MDDKTTQVIEALERLDKKVKPTAWKHSQWIHFTLADGSVVMVNPANVNYIHRGIDDAVYADPAKPMVIP